MEPREIARDMHDGLMQELALIGMQAQRLAQQDPDNPELQLLEAASRRALDEVRHVMEALTGNGDAPPRGLDVPANGRPSVPADRPIRVVVADDHPPIRAGVRLALESDGFEVCAEVADGPAAVKAAIDHRPDICLLDVHMPGNGVVAAGEIANHVPETVIVMLTVSRNDDDLFNALRVGASGYLLKDTDPGRLPLALRGVLDGEAALPRTLGAKVIDEFRERGRRRRLPLIGSRGADLTSREWEVLHLLADGLSTSQLASRLNISQVTVRRHVSSILQKLQVPDRATAVRLMTQP